MEAVADGGGDAFAGDRGNGDARVIGGVGVVEQVEQPGGGLHRIAAFAKRGVAADRAEQPRRNKVKKQSTKKRTSKKMVAST